MTYRVRLLKKAYYIVLRVEEGRRGGGRGGWEFNTHGKF